MGWCYHWSEFRQLKQRIALRCTLRGFDETDYMDEASVDLTPTRFLVPTQGNARRLLPSGAYFGQRVPRATLSCRRCPPRWSSGVAWRKAAAYKRILAGCHVTFQLPVPSYNL